MTRSLSALCSAGLALVGCFLIAVDQHDLQTCCRAHLRNAGAHETGANHADFFQTGRRFVGRAPRAFVEVLHRHEQRADHRGRYRRAQDFGEPARLNAQRRIKLHLQAFIDDLEDGARGRIIVVGLAPINRVGRREGHHSRLGIDRPARQAETFRVPRRLGFAAGLDPVLCRLDQIRLRHHRIDQLHRLGAIDFKLVALEQELQCIGGLQHARDALSAAGARKKADLDFGQTKPRFRVVGGDAIMAGEREFETATHGRPVERADPGLAGGFEAPIEQRQLAAFLEYESGGCFLAFCADKIGEDGTHTLEHRKVGAAAEGFLAGGDDHTFDSRVGGDLINQGAEFLDHARGDDVHRTIGHVPGDERDSVAVDLEFEVAITGSSSFRHLHLLSHLRISKARRSFSCSARPFRRAPPSCRYRNNVHARPRRACRPR